MSYGSAARVIGAPHNSAHDATLVQNSFFIMGSRWSLLR
jgi:hypothetical protein